MKLFILGMMTALGAVAFGNWLGNGGFSRTEITHEVRKGETIWQIAATRTPKGEDVNKTVNEIAKENGLKTLRVKEGDMLTLPRR